MGQLSQKHDPVSVFVLCTLRGWRFVFVEVGPMKWVWERDESVRTGACHKSP
jgi:hypothetical protein